jgi:hypothetical protein
MRSNIDGLDGNIKNINSNYEPLNSYSLPPKLDEKIEDKPPKNDRKKTEIRMHFDGEVEIIKKQIGTLEEVRIKLDLSARKMCQLLMVDPSAWNRWTTGVTPPPPHIYRALQWYMMLNDKLPGVDPRFFLPKKSFFRSPGAVESLSKNEDLKNEPLKKATETKEINEKISEQLMMTQYYQTQSKNYEIEVKSLKIQLNTFQKLLTMTSITLGLLFVLGFLKVFILK